MLSFYWQIGPVDWLNRSKHQDSPKLRAGGQLTHYGVHWAMRLLLVNSRSSYGLAYGVITAI